MDHLVQFTISVDDDNIKRAVEESARKQIIDGIRKDVEDIIFEKRYGYNSSKDNTPLKKMVRECVETVIAENKEVIIQEAIKGLTDKLSRTKMAKEALSELINPVEEPILESAT